MKFKLFILLSVMFASCAQPKPEITADWESIKTYPKCPEWFADAKFGIYTHWGPQSIPEAAANAAGYPSYMYRKNRKHFDFHKANFGDQHEFGFKDFIPMFTAEKFDVEEWADLFANSGAKFAGPVAVHHDNFAMWDSKATPWNAKNMGPKLDITGQMARAYKERGLKFIATFHHSWTWGYSIEAQNYDGADSATWQLYGEPREIVYNEKMHASNATYPTKRYLDQWKGMIDEVVSQYEPEMIWFDIALDGRKCIPTEYQQQMFADYYNWANKNGKEVLVGHKEKELLPYAGVKDYERGRSEYLTTDVWMTDGTIGRSWFYEPKWDNAWQDANWVVDILMDIIAKNGVLLLNVPPRPDGSIPEWGTKELLKIGAWMKANGDAVYNTRPWLVYGEPHKALSARHGRGDESKKVVYGSEDIRFTQSKDGKVVNAIVLGWPEESFVIKSIKVDKVHRKSKITLLGCDDSIDYTINDQQQLCITPPAQQPNEIAFCFQIEGFDLSPHAEADKKAFAVDVSQEGFSNVAE